MCGGEQKKRQEHPALSVMPEQAAPAPDIAEILMQLSELTLTGRQVGADRTGSAAGQTGEGGSAGSPVANVFVYAVSHHAHYCHSMVLGTVSMLSTV